MKKALIFICCFALLVTVCSFAVSAETSVFKISDIEGKYKTQGRTELVDDTLFMDWSASGIEFSANCSGDVSIKVNTTRIRITSGDTGGIYFTVVIDGVVQYSELRIPKDNNATRWTSNSTKYPFVIRNKGITEFVIAKDLSPGVHKFEIYNQTEANDGAFGIQSISLNGEILTKKGNNELLIEFVGDSITAGYGNISVGGKGRPLYQDATRGWPYLTAKKLNADWSVIAQSGITASNGVGWSAGAVSMQTVYPKLRYYSNNITNYDFKRTADIVVLGLGTNDLWTYQNSGKSLDYLKGEFQEMIKLVRKHNPNAKIIWIYGMMINTADGLIKGAVKELGGSKNGIYTLSLPRNVAGGEGHPDLSAQQSYADSLSSFIKAVLNNTVLDDEPVSVPNNSTNNSGNSTVESEQQSASDYTSESSGSISNDKTTVDNQDAQEESVDTATNTEQNKTAKSPDNFLIIISIIAFILIAGLIFIIFSLIRKPK
ncbi:MAG: hypothetical protein IKD04_00595 [Clostridia bacterium]|nr:hypothetical protein [Clostridia bacterium]